MSVREWATHSLRRGDLTALASVARGSKPEEDRLSRLERRRFIKAKANGAPVVTARGRMALVLRSLIK